MLEVIDACDGRQEDRKGEGGVVGDNPKNKKNTPQAVARRTSGATILAMVFFLFTVPRPWSDKIISLTTCLTSHHTSIRQ